MRKENCKRLIFQKQNVKAVKNGSTIAIQFLDPSLGNNEFAEGVTINTELRLNPTKQN